MSRDTPPLFPPGVNLIPVEVSLHPRFRQATVSPLTTMGCYKRNYLLLASDYLPFTGLTYPHQVFFHHLVFSTSHTASKLHTNHYNGQPSQVRTDP